METITYPMTPDTHCFREESQTERCDACGWLAQAHTGCDCDEGEELSFG